MLPRLEEVEAQDRPGRGGRPRGLARSPAGHRAPEGHEAEEGVLVAARARAQVAGLEGYEAEEV